MYEKTVVLFECIPLEARISREACATARRGRQEPKFNMDHEGDTFRYEECDRCPGLEGRGAAVTITAGPPRPPRVAVLTIDGSYGYV